MTTLARSQSQRSGRQRDSWVELDPGGVLSSARSPWVWAVEATQVLHTDPTNPERSRSSPFSFQLEGYPEVSQLFPRLLEAPVQQRKCHGLVRCICLQSNRQTGKVPVSQVAVILISFEQSV